MTSTNNGPNTRGTAKRSNKKEIRVATHAEVLKFVIDNFHPSTIIEHGMGISSTPLLHSFDCVKKIISIEDDTRWRECKTCNASKTPKIDHLIISYSQFSDEMITDDKDVIVFLDGTDAQRASLVERAMKANVKAIVEHDAESFSAERIKLIVSFGGEYALYQYIKENPETGLYVLKSQNLSVGDDYVDLKLISD